MKLLKILTSLSNIYNEISFKLSGAKNYEAKLLKCQSYKLNNILQWKLQTNLNWKETIKFIDKIQVFDAEKIRSTIEDIVRDNKSIFDTKNLFITSFGSEGKSGGKIAYEFRHTKLGRKYTFISSWDLPMLPENSTIIFVEDLIGTGYQSTEYILEKLNLMLSPSHKPYLLTICATPEGIHKVQKETNFNIINGILLEENKYQYNSSNCTFFNSKEKDKLFKLNEQLKKPHKPDYDKGLLVTFFYSPPNNSMPILWKDQYPYVNQKGETKKWHALIPREY